MLVRASKPVRVVENVVKDEDVSIRNRFFSRAFSPATEKLIRVTTARIAVARSRAEDHLDTVTPTSDSVEGVVRHDDVESTVDPDGGTFGVVDDIIENLISYAS